MSDARYSVIVERERNGALAPLDEMHIGPMSEAGADRLAARVNGIEGLIATVYPLYAPRDPDLIGEILAMRPS